MQQKDGPAVLRARRHIVELGAVGQGGPQLLFPIHGVTIAPAGTGCPWWGEGTVGHLLWSR